MPRDSHHKFGCSGFLLVNLPWIWHQPRDAGSAPYGASGDSSEAGRFDVVYVTAVSCHLADLSGFFGEVCRVLRPGGALVGGEWFKAGDNQAFLQWDDLLRKRGLNFFFVARSEFEQALRDGGFDSISVVDRTRATEELALGYLRRVETDIMEQLLASLGEQGFASFLDWTRSRVSSLAAGGMHYGHFQARKPA